MAKNFWFPLYYRDYTADVVMLTNEQRGIYIGLIVAYYQAEKPLPDDNGKLGLIAGISASEFKKHRPALSDFFQIADGLWRHKRIDRELTAMKAREKRAKSGAISRWNHCNKVAKGNA